MKDYLIARAKEPSTWRGFIYVLTAAGVSVRPELQEYIITTGIGIAGIIGVFIGDSLNAGSNA